jgi:hypothetical protein
MICGTTVARVSLLDELEPVLADLFSEIPVVGDAAA